MTRDQSLQPTTKAPAVSTEAKDGVQNYAHRVLELGLLYKDLLDMCKLPSRARALPLLKLIMLLFKVNSNLSKYALEVMRLLVHQLCSLSEQAAHEEFYGLFVNTEGSPAGHVACDDRMEWQGELGQRPIQHMASNKSEKNISNRSRALSGTNYDRTTQVLVRSKKHKVAPAREDELAMVTDLHQLRPFQFHAGRCHSAFENISGSMLSEADFPALQRWLEDKAYMYATELGN